MAGRLEGKVIAITGAGAGIGRSCVERFLDEGASVVAADKDATSLEDLAESVDGPIETVVADLVDEQASAEIVERTLGSFGRLDVFHANAGGAFPTAFEEMQDGDYERVRSLNVDAVWHGARASIPVFLEAGKGVFLVTSSGAGFNAVEGLSAYGMAKAGVQSLVKTLTLEYGKKGIRACAISPGPIESPGLLSWLETLPGGVEGYARNKVMGRLGKSEEIAAAAAFLASDDASFVSGVTLPVDGGAQAVL
ncbi:MAG: SDR family NAD(P)-dependent oxidoreductase [Acidimicrobiales bacterium]|nr:SDR family NAD(P)-dependent oxidoreductase [Acidimicrobiales bacterium]